MQITKLLIGFWFISMSLTVQGQHKTLTQHETMGIQQLKSGGSVGVNLTGTGIPIGVFEADAGMNQFLHDTTLSDLQHVVVTEAGSTSTHATTVVKILTSKGVAIPSEVGVAPNADVFIFGLNNGHVSMANELGTAIRERNLLISNHSHSENNGWSTGTYWNGVIDISATEDYKFGYYGDLSRTFDSIMVEHPYHTIVKAVGNDRSDVNTATPFTVWDYNAGSFTRVSRTSPIPEDDGGADGYDCLSRDNTSKNALVVGAIDNISGGYNAFGDISFTNSSSSFGPTDDARVKPDLVGPGQLTNGTSYTSYSAPMISGLAALMQELYRDEYGRWMRSSTLKALLIHTADPASGNGSPVPTAGWGLPNALTAVHFVLDTLGQQRIIEAEIQQGETKTFRFYHDGTTDFRATLAWIDPIGSSPSIENNATDLDDSTAILVHDLDMELWEEDGTPSLFGQPWKLSALHPGNSATTGDNNVDNVERIDIPSASIPAGWYTIRISHDGSITGKQSFSLLISDAQGESFNGGTWSNPPNTWNSDVFVHIQDSSNIARLSDDVTISYLLMDVGTDLHINEANTLTISGEALLKADANGTAQIKGPISGIITRQSYVSGSAGWRYLHAPLKTDIGSWAEELTRVQLSGNSSPSIYRWDAANTQWNALASSDSAHQQGGISIYLGTNAYAKFSSLPFAKSARGEQASRHPTLNLTVDDDTDAGDDDLGWNLIGHPYLAPVAWASIDRSEVGNSFYVWNTAQNDFAASDGTTATGGGTNYIPPGQSVWVYCASGEASTLTWDTSAVVLSQDHQVLKQQPAQVRLSWEMDSLKEEVVLVFESGADTSLDLSSDVLLREGGDPYRTEMYWNVEGEKVVINKVSMKEAGFARLLIEPGQYSFSGFDIQSISVDPVQLYWTHDSMRFALNAVPPSEWEMGGSFQLHWSGVNIGSAETIPHFNHLYYADGALHWKGNKELYLDIWSIGGRWMGSIMLTPSSRRFLELSTGIYIARDREGNSFQFNHIL